MRSLMSVSACSPRRRSADVVVMEPGEDVVGVVGVAGVGREGEGEGAVVPMVPVVPAVVVLVAVLVAVPVVVPAVVGRAAVAGARVEVAVVPPSTCRTPLPSLPSVKWLCCDGAMQRNGCLERWRSSEFSFGRAGG